MSNLHRASIPGARRVNSTRPAITSEQRPVALPLSTPKLPADLFAWLPESAWSVTGTSVERQAVHHGRSVRVSVTTVVDTFERPTRTIVVPSEPFIDDAEVFPSHDLYVELLDQAERFVDRNQGALLMAHGEGGA